MSRNLKQSRHFILLLLENNLDLNKHILIHASSSQLKAIAEIFYLFIWGFTSLSTLYRSFYNVFKLPLSKKKREKFINYLKILKKFIKSEEKGRRILARKHFERLSNLLVSIKYYIAKILE